jgi:hypothetical protein
VFIVVLPGLDAFPDGQMGNDHFQAVAICGLSRMDFWTVTLGVEERGRLRRSAGDSMS